MILLRGTLIAFLVCSGAAVIGMAAWFELSRKSNFDRAHPDYGHFAERFTEARRAFSAGQDYAVIDLAPVNRGAWRTACLFGGYTKPVQHMDALGAVVSQADRNRLGEPVGLRLSPVEEYEVLIAFVDEGGRAHFVHFHEGIGAEGQHVEACTTKPETRVAIASWGGITPGAANPLADGRRSDGR